MLRKLLDRLRARLAAGARPQQGLRSLAHLALLALLDGLGVFAVWLVCHIAVGLWFTGATGQDKLAVAVLTGIFSWRLYVLLFRILLQPDMPDARLCEAQDGDARAMYDSVSAVMLLIILGRILHRVLSVIDTPPQAMAAYGAIAVLLYFAALVWLVVRSRAAARQWLVGLGTVAPLAGVIGRHWVGVGIVFFAVLGVTQFYGAVTDRVHVAAAMLLTLNLVVGVLVFETLLQAFVRRLDLQLVGQTPASDTPKLPDVVARCVRVAVLIAVAVAISESWVVEVLGLVSEDEWVRFTRSSRTAGITLFLAFVAWELFKYKVDPYMGRKPAGAAGPLADGDGAVKSASRLSTLMPLRASRSPSRCVVPLIVRSTSRHEHHALDRRRLGGRAGDLLRQPDARPRYRVRRLLPGRRRLPGGRVHRCGKAKGTVEGFTLRSIRLRHQNGQVHTIPFGQLGQITNFSRDWISLKFNLRFSRGTDLEKLRKAVKKIGTEMLEIPEFKAEILAPLKMQGVADITDNAMVVRFKLIVKPGNPA